MAQKKEDDSTLSVAKAREMAAKMNAQLEQGVMEAERRNEQANQLL